MGSGLQPPFSCPCFTACPTLLYNQYVVGTHPAFSTEVKLGLGLCLTNELELMPYHTSHPGFIIAAPPDTPCGITRVNTPQPHQDKVRWLSFICCGRWFKLHCMAFHGCTGMAMCSLQSAEHVQRGQHTAGSHSTMNLWHFFPVTIFCVISTLSFGMALFPRVF